MTWLHKACDEVILIRETITISHQYEMANDWGDILEAEEAWDDEPETSKKEMFCQDCEVNVTEEDCYFDREQPCMECEGE